MNQQDARPTLSPAEVEEAIRLLSEADSIRLRNSSKYYAHSAISADDLLQEAFCRALDGRRRCPTDVDVVRFLTQAMRSIASEKREKSKRQGVVVSIERDDGIESVIPSPPTVEETAIRDEEASRIRSAIISLFDDDETARDLAEGIMEEFTREELRELTDLDKTAYDTKRKLIRRRIQKTYPEGWIR